MDHDKYDLLKAYFEEKIPFNKHLGMRVERLEEGICVLVVPFREHLIGDASRPALHGGVSSALADAAGGLAVYSTLQPGAGVLSTVDLRVDYLRPGLLEDLSCTARVVRVGNRVAVTSMVVHQGAHVAAECRGVYNVIRADAGD